MPHKSISTSKGAIWQFSLRDVGSAVCFALTLLFAGCGTHSPLTPDGFDIPAKYRSETVVVPAELLAAYQDLQQQPDKYDWSYNEAVWSIPLEYRRAHIYQLYESIYGNGEPPPTSFFRKIDVYCDPNAEGGGSALAQGVAEATGLAQMLPDHPVSIIIELAAGRSLKRGELAWLAEQALLYAPDKIFAVVPWFGAGHG